MKGYTVAVVNANRQADQSLLGVRMGRLSIENNISVQQLADHLGATRSAVYAWILGASVVTREPHLSRVKRLVKKLESA